MLHMITELPKALEDREQLHRAMRKVRCSRTPGRLLGMGYFILCYLAVEMDPQLMSSLLSFSIYSHCKKPP